MKQILLTLMVVVATTYVSAQQIVILQSNGTTTAFDSEQPFIDAYESALDGDTIYLPGAVLTPPSTIDKQLTIYGVGHYPEATIATNKTVINGHVYINENSDNIRIEGVEITGTLLFNNNQKIDSATITRCKLNQVYLQGDGTTPCVNTTIKNCVITSNITLSNAYNCTFTNNIIATTVVGGIKIALLNNIFLYSSTSTSSGTIRSVNNSTIANNIFRRVNNLIQSDCETSTFSNNVFKTTALPGVNTFINNYENVDFASLFVNQGDESTFTYEQDYNLTNTETYLGNDGTQVGIYGGLFPYKEEAIPSNPHISSQSIATSTDENGMLNISITVSAQQE
ncbi:right-handed parallel beta-helix repeat-containing protein [Carboxylicivirga linearis]|uniref:Periplasmic copper-binding protein NosD beta helix domain-containing protein n=1 Tax=Carboxylicivirga linearis TaxID=1628157 RepID=A0ABS5JYF0_9BACT|nr:hypothetical protein [Carboxylicivirga linearis]MBS2099933.1 hypothetical protein [Carboxylicivirga linearis]